MVWWWSVERLFGDKQNLFFFLWGNILRQFVSSIILIRDRTGTILDISSYTSVFRPPTGEDVSCDWVWWKDKTWFWLINNHFMYKRLKLIIKQKKGNIWNGLLEIICDLIILNRGNGDTVLNLKIVPAIMLLLQPSDSMAKHAGWFSMPINKNRRNLYSIHSVNYFLIEC